MYNSKLHCLNLSVFRRHGGVKAQLTAQRLDHRDHDGVEVTDGLEDDGDLMTSADHLVASILPPPPPSVAEYILSGITALRKSLTVSPSLLRSPQQVKHSRSFLPVVETTSVEGSKTNNEPEVFFDKSEHPANQVNTDSDYDETDRTYGIGAAGEILGDREFKRSARRNRHIMNQLEDIEDYRPFFTYWITTSQVLVMIVSLLLYGFGPLGVELYHGKGQVLSRGLFIEEVEFLEPSNFWFGPRPADLIHLGAKFSPCMRPDREISKEIQAARELEAETGCCIRQGELERGIKSFLPTQQIQAKTTLSTATY